MPEKASSWAIYETFDTADGKIIFIGITSDNHWRRFCEEFQLHDLLVDPTLKTNPLRARAHDRLAPIVAAIVKAQTFDAMATRLEALDIPFAPLAKPGDLFDDPHLNQSGRMVDILLPTGKWAKIPGLPLDMDGRKPHVRLQPPKMGEHTSAVLAEAGYNAAQIDDLIKQRVVIMSDR
jgi:crotonobetainyl-CoA:carnitine CoA-transferase CaiB-like acyl-CoA transferase